MATVVGRGQSTRHDICLSCEDDILSASISPASDYLATCDPHGRALAGVVRPLGLLQRILYFVYPERVLLSRLPPHLRRFLRQDFAAMKWQLQKNRFTYTLAGVPVTLLCCPPGMWADLLPRLGLTEEEACQEQLCFAQQPEGFAALSCIVAKHGSALRTLRIAVDARDGPARGAAATGAAALLFSLVARGDLCQLKSLTLVDAGGARPGTGSFLAPLARRGAEPLQQLLSLRLSLAGPEAKAHLGCLATFAHRGGLRSLRALVVAPSEEAQAEDEDLARLLRALGGHSVTADAAVPAVATAAAAESRRPPPEHAAAAAAPRLPLSTSMESSSSGASPRPSCALRALDLTNSLAGPATLEVLRELLEGGGGQHMAVLLEGTPASTDPDNEALYGKIQRLLSSRPS